MQGLITMKTHVKYEHSFSSGSKIMAKVKVSHNTCNRSNFKVKVTRSKIWYPLKGLVIRKGRMKYETLSIHVVKFLSMHRPTLTPGV